MHPDPFQTLGPKQKIKCLLAKKVVMLVVTPITHHWYNFQVGLLAHASALAHMTAKFSLDLSAMPS